MHGLTDHQAALAHDGRISVALKSRSPVYYWQHTDQAAVRHEAVCRKQGRWHLITFGSHARFQELARRKCAVAHRTMPTVDTCTNLSLASLPEEWARAHDADVSTRGAGWWRWKPYLIQRRLRELEEGDVLVHLDYDLVMDRDPKALFCLGQVRLE